MRPLVLILLSFAAFAQHDISTNPNQTRDRGQTRPPDESQSMTRGRVGTQQPLPGKVQDFSGTLVDASCDDRSTLNLNQQPAQPDIATQNSAPQPDPGVKVDPKTVQKERADAMAHQNADIITRQPDRSCSINSSTRGFALLMSNGRLVNLDEGGTTMVMQAIQETPAGRAMLNGAGAALKPQVTLRGRVRGDRLIVEKILKL
jgi:hypothetical protein